MAATDKTLNLADIATLGIRGAAIAVAISDPAGVCRKSLLIRHSELDAVQVEPAMMPCARNIVHLSVCEDIHTQSVLVVVEVEDHTLVRAAICRESHQGIAHAMPPDETTYHTEIAIPGRAGCLIAVTVCHPAALQSSRANTGLERGGIRAALGRDFPHREPRVAHEVCHTGDPHIAGLSVTTHGSGDTATPLVPATLSRKSRPVAVVSRNINQDGSLVGTLAGLPLDGKLGKVLYRTEVAGPLTASDS